TRARAAIAPAFDAGKPLLDLVDPENRWCNRLGELDDAPHILLGRSDNAAEEFTNIQTQKRLPPFRGDCLCGEALAACGHADQQQAFRRWQAEVSRALAEARRAHVQPYLELVHAS